VQASILVFPIAGAWPLEHPLAASVAWTALPLAVFVPLCTTRYARPA
jgi:ABC-2 type transport system permease protein